MWTKHALFFCSIIYNLKYFPLARVLLEAYIECKGGYTCFILQKQKCFQISSISAWTENTKLFLCLSLLSITLCLWSKNKLVKTANKVFFSKSHDCKEYRPIQFFSINRAGVFKIFWVWSWNQQWKPRYPQSPLLYVSLSLAEWALSFSWCLLSLLSCSIFFLLLLHYMSLLFSHVFICSLSALSWLPQMPSNMTFHLWKYMPINRYPLVHAKFNFSTNAFLN